MSEWNFMSPESKDNLLAVLSREAEGLMALAGEPGAWEAPTAAGHWRVGDIVGHLVDTTEGYFVGFDAARGNGQAAEPLGVRGMDKMVDQGAAAFRGTPQTELLDRLRTDYSKMTDLFESLTPEDWGGLMVPHKYMGPLPSFFYPIFQLVDYAVHAWDIRQGSGGAHGLAGDTADLLVPLCFVLWQATADCAPVTEPFEVGVVVTSGANQGGTRLSVGPEGIAAEAGPVDGLPVVLEFDPASLVLTAYGRANAGTTRGDTQLGTRYLNLFFRI